MESRFGLSETGVPGNQGVPSDGVRFVGVKEEVESAREVAGVGEAVDEGGGEEGVEDEA